MDPPSTVSSQTASRVKIKCKYCGHKLERRNLKSHTKRVHSGFLPAERASSTQGVLSFRINTVKRPEPVNNNRRDCNESKTGG